jgi:hypothetical protein
MKKTIIVGCLLGISIFVTSCSVFEGRPEQDNANQARGSWTWMNQRLDEEQEGRQLDGQFGNQSNADLNDESPNAVDLNSTFPDMKSN